MNGVFILLLLLSLVGLVWGLVAPHHIAKAARVKRELTRKHTGFGFTALAMTLLVLVGVTAPPQKPITIQQASLKAKSQSSQSSSSATSGSQSQPAAPTVTTKQETETQSIPFATQNQDYSSLPKGQTKVVRQGQNGEEMLTYDVTYTNGVQTSKSLTSTVVTIPVVNQIIDVGVYVAPVPKAKPKSTPSPAPAPSQACHPLTSGGNCYEPGEFCSNADHGMTGLAGDGKTIVCTNNNGWRWEPN